MAWYSGWASATSAASVSMPTSGSPARYLRHASKKVSRTWSRLGLNTRLLPEFAKVADQALWAAGLARDAHVAPVEDQPVVRVLQELRRRELEQLLLDLQRILARREVGAIRDAEDMRVDRDRRLPERGIQHHVRRLATDAGQRFQLLARRRHLAAVLLHQDARQLDYVLRLGAVQADALDVFLQPGHAEPGDLLRRVVLLVEHVRRQVDGFVRRLRREHDG